MGSGSAHWSVTHHRTTSSGANAAAAVSTGPDASAANSHGTASLHVATSSVAPAKKVVASVAPTVPKAPSPVSTGKSVTRKITRKIVKYASVDECPTFRRHGKLNSGANLMREFGYIVGQGSIPGSMAG